MSLQRQAGGFALQFQAEDAAAAAAESAKAATVVRAATAAYTRCAAELAENWEDIIVTEIVALKQTLENLFNC